MLFPSREQVFDAAGTGSLTSKQRQILLTLKMQSADGDFMDLDELLMRLPYRTTKQSLQFSIRALIGHGLIEKKGLAIRRGRQRRLLGLTPAGYEFLTYY